MVTVWLLLAQHSVRVDSSSATTTPLCSAEASSLHWCQKPHSSTPIKNIYIKRSITCWGWKYLLQGCSDWLAVLLSVVFFWPKPNTSDTRDLICHRALLLHFHLVSFIFQMSLLKHNCPFDKSYVGYCLAKISLKDIVLSSGIYVWWNPQHLDVFIVYLYLLYCVDLYKCIWTQSKCEASDARLNINMVGGGGSLV